MLRRAPILVCYKPTIRLVFADYWSAMIVTIYLAMGCLTFVVPVGLNGMLNMAVLVDLGNEDSQTAFELPRLTT